MDYEDIPLDEHGSPLVSPIKYSCFDIAKQLEELYITYRGRFVMMTLDGGVFVPRYKDSKSGKIKDQKITNKIICGHLNGNYAICVYAGSASSKFICFDVDDGNPQTVRTIIDILSKVGFPRERIYVSTSGGKGFHVEMFFSSLMFTSDLKNVYNYVCAVGKLDTSKVEFRPTGGQSIKLPLSVHRKTGNTCWYLERDTLEPIMNPEYIMEIRQIPHELALSISKNLPCYGYTLGYEREKIAERLLSDEELNAFDGDYYPDLTESGKRNALMVQIAVHNRYRNMSKDQCEVELRNWYHRQNPEFIKSPEEFVEMELGKILDWVYGEKFVIGARRRDIVFRKDDLRILFSQRKRSERTLIFLIQYYSKAHGSCCLSVKRISELTGLGERTVYTTLQSLADNRWVDLVSASSVRKKDGGYVRSPNRYRVSDRSYNWAAGAFEYMPTVDEEKRKSVFSIQMNTDEIKLEPDIGLDKAYHDVLTSFLSDKELRERLTKKEYKEIENYEHRDSK